MRTTPTTRPAVSQGPERLWGPVDVGHYFGISDQTVRAWRKQGKLPPPKMTIGRQILWEPEAIRSMSGAI